MALDAPPPPRRSPAGALLVALRPKQWSKNLVVFAGLLFTLDKHHTLGQAGRVFLGFVLFSVVSSVVYLVNDTVDRDSDRLHPTKRRRPIACGELSIGSAMCAAVILAVIGLAGSFLLSVPFGAVVLLYFLLTLGYSFSLKHVVILDVLIIAIGFVLRAIAGVLLLGVLISQWLILCTLMLMLFLALSKRRAELLGVHQAGGKSTRPILGEYSAPMLDQMIVIVTSAVVMSYSLYTIQSDAALRHPYLMATIPFVIYGVFRYLYLMHRHQLGESPDAVLAEDRPSLINIALWAIFTAVIVTHATPHLGLFPH